MDITFDVFNGLAIGIQYVGKSQEDDIEESVIIVEFLCFRAMIWLND